MKKIDFLQKCLKAGMGVEAAAMCAFEIGDATIAQATPEMVDEIIATIQGPPEEGN